jgi:hypothetical protein
MRYLAAVCALTLALGAFAQTAWAASAYDDVPATDCAYAMLNQLVQGGALPDYPAGFFSGKRTLTRYEFAQATAKLLDQISQHGAAQDVQVQADALRSEFAAELAQLQPATGELGSRTAEQGQALQGLGADLDTHDRRIAALDDKLCGLKDAGQWHGEFDYRMVFDHRRGGPVDDGFRQGACLRLGYTEQLSSQVTLCVQLESVGGNFGADPFRYFGAGTGPFGKSRIGLDQAYVKYAPKWGGYYATGQGPARETHPKVEIMAGELGCAVHDAGLETEAK